MSIIACYVIESLYNRYTIAEPMSILIEKEMISVRVDTVEHGPIANSLVEKSTHRKIMLYIFKLTFEIVEQDLHA